MHTKFKTVLKSTSSDIWTESKLNSSSSKLVRFSKQISNANILAPVIQKTFCWEVGQSISFADNIQTGYTRRIKTTSHRQDFIIQRFFWLIVNLLNLNIFGVLQFPIGVALQITWTVICYEPTSTPEKLCPNLWQKVSLRMLPTLSPCDSKHIVHIYCLILSRPWDIYECWLQFNIKLDTLNAMSCIPRVLTPFFRKSSKSH